MKSYQRTKQLMNVKYKLLNIALFPVKCICTPIYNLHEKHRKDKRYSYKAILGLVQYCIDYHLSDEDYIYVVYSDTVGQDAEDCGCYGYYELKNISWGWSGGHKRVKNKLNHIYYYQKEEYIQAVKEICGQPMNKEELKIEFTRTSSDNKSYLAWGYYNIQDKEVCKIMNK